MSRARYLESRFHLSPWQLACELGLVGASASVSLLALVPRLQPRLGDLALMRLGMVAILGFFISRVSDRSMS